MFGMKCFEMFSSRTFLLFLFKMFFSTRKSRKGQEGEGLFGMKCFEMFSPCTFLLLLLKIDRREKGI